VIKKGTARPEKTFKKQTHKKLTIKEANKLPSEHFTNTNQGALFLHKSNISKNKIKI
jgi:hypothetical protein